MHLLANQRSLHQENQNETIVSAHISNPLYCVNINLMHKHFILHHQSPPKLPI